MVDVRALASDAVIVLDGDVLLLERDHPPFEGQWVLPGGLLERDETAREALRPRDERGSRPRRRGDRGVSLGRSTGV
ncbi:NUDIX hydrolase [Natronomonas sp. LN261]|jgi:hypothetical protein|uniref:NUDIX hydrolase n=1 Tax=Natronomonas sp. LN261 TaxID=2750669 RepID=UPI0015EF426F|nr:NUDIX domain-containing protein [Natronomonas sp. LN261]